MKLYHSPTSPFVRKVDVLLREADRVESVAFVPSMTAPTAPAAGLEAKNPLKKIPALERDDGPTLYDSRVICAYLDDLLETGLYGTGARRWEMLTLEATADGIMEAALMVTFEGRLRPEDKRWDDWVSAQWGKVTSGCAAIEARWMGHLSGPLNIGQIAVGCALGYLDFRHDARNWRDGCPALAAWYAAFSERPSMIATRPPEGM